MILIVEQLARIYARVLETHAFDVAVALTGGLGLNLMSQLQVDLVLADLKLPDMSGVEFIRRARERGYAGPAIAVTGYPEAIVGEDLSEFVMEAQKPLPLSQLLQMVRQALGLPMTEEGVSLDAQ